MTDDFVISARKYRPQAFDEVVGQDHITTTLKNAIANNKVAQSLLFCGPRGVGKTTCARIVARLINRLDEQAEKQSLTIFELDAASNNSVEDIRRLMEQVRYPPPIGKFKVYIIDEVHMLSQTAFNVFLKTLEEPPPYAIFILATTEKHKVLPTILSRCQIFDFNRIEIADIANQLKKIAEREKISAEPEALHIIAQKADGAMRDALSLFDLMVTFSAGKSMTFAHVLANLHILDYDYFFTIVQGFFSRCHTAPLLLFDEILRKGFDGHHFIAGLQEHLRCLLMLQDARTLTLMDVPDSVREKYSHQARFAPPSLLLAWLSLAAHCDREYKSSKNQRLLVELTLLKMANIFSVVDETDIKEKKSVNKPSEQPKVEEPKSIKPLPLVEKPTVSTGVMPPVELKKGPQKTINLKDMFQQPKKEEVKEQVKRTKPIALEALQRAWAQFSETKKENKVEHKIFSYEYSLTDTTITLSLENTVEESVLTSFKEEFLTFLKDTLENDLLSIVVQMTKGNDKKVAYTNHEKFKEMAKKNPLLLELQQKFQLDPDF